MHAPPQSLFGNSSQPVRRVIARAFARSFGIHAAIVAVLFGVIVWAYHPSLGHGPRADQCCWLLDTIDQDDFLSLTARTYSYSRTRVVMPGDSPLFRPVLFTLLSAEKALFGNNFALWQWFGIALHCLAVYLFLHLLLRMHRMTPMESADSPVAESCRRDAESSQRSAAGAERSAAKTPHPRSRPSRRRARGGCTMEELLTERRLLKGLAYALAFFFALNYAVVEMVVWSHINGYLLFIVFALAASLLVLKVVAEPETALLRRSAGAFLLLLLSAFTYEIGQFLAVIAGAVLATSVYRRGQRGRALALFALFASILPLYQGINQLDKAVHPSKPDSTLTLIRERAVTHRTLEHAGRYVLYHAVQPFFPAQARWWFPGRIAVAEPVLTWEDQVRAGPVQLASLAAFAAGLLLSLRGLYHFATRPGRMRKLLIVVLPLSFFVLHGAVTVLGRMNLRVWPDVLAINSYYVYLPLLGVLTSLYAIWTCAASPARTRGRLVLPVCFTLFLALAVLSVYSGRQVRQINESVKNALRPVRTTTKTLKQFIDAHQNEPDFSFALDASVCNGAASFHGVPLPVFLFKHYIDNHHPKYVFTWKDGKLLARRCGEESPDQPHLPQIVPDLVRVGTEYNFFFFDGWYYGVRCQDGYYRPEREQYASLIVARTLEGALRQTQRPAVIVEWATFWERMFRTKRREPGK